MHYIKTYTDMAKLIVKAIFISLSNCFNILTFLLKCLEGQLQICVFLAYSLMMETGFQYYTQNYHR